MVEACLRNKKHYTDITGEISVFESMAALDDKAKGVRSNDHAGCRFRRGSE
jgi:short subunit dehydrogenase-like uncharacterized protein